jgi:hypothetical protein
LCTAIALFAQESDANTETKTGKKDYSYLLPQAGDFALVVDASPFLEYVADLLNFSGGNPATAPVFQSFRANIMGKYFFNSTSALRLRLEADVNNANEANYVRDDEKFLLENDASQVVSDLWKHKNSNFEIGGGYEKRIGFRRMQGYIGGEVFLGYGKLTDTYTYGNPISQTNPVPSSFNFNGNINGGVRTLYSKQNSTFIYGLRGIVGVDIFLMPNLAIGGEIAFEARGTKGGTIYTTTEEWETYQVSTKENLASPGNSSFTIDAIPITSLSISIFF